MAWRNRMEIAANTSLIVASLMGTAVGINYFKASRQIKNHGLLSERQSSPDLVGKTINLPGVKWSQGRPALVLALSTTCHYCAASMPFYQTLSLKAQNDHVETIVVMPQSENEASAYLATKEVRVSQVVRAKLSEIHVDGTPTVLLVNSQGVVSKSWIGAVSESTQKEILNAI